jgi:hypothetical protein
MKQLIGLVHLGALTALSVKLCRGRRQTQATETTHNRYLKKPDHPAEPGGELVLLGFDGTIIAREVNLAARCAKNGAAHPISESGRD